MDIATERAQYDTAFLLALQALDPDTRTVLREDNTTGMLLQAVAEWQEELLHRNRQTQVEGRLLGVWNRWNANRLTVTNPHAAFLHGYNERNPVEWQRHQDQLRDAARGIARWVTPFPPSDS